MYTLIFYINKILFLPILYMNNACFNQSFVKTAYQLYYIVTEKISKLRFCIYH